MVKWLIRGAILILSALILYVTYIYVSYERIEDNLAMAILPASQDNISNKELEIETTYSAISYNIGFSAYTPDFSFFMDGGEYSWAKSKESVITTTESIAQLLLEDASDFIVLQEVDLNGTRSHHIDEWEILTQRLNEYHHTFAINYNSAFLFYPILQPHGKNISGLGTLSRFPITSAIRRSLPISTSLNRFLDLDRAFTVSRFSVNNSKEFIVINVHLTAYGSDESIRKEQFAMLRYVMEEEWNKGNYILVGGDFNHDLKRQMGENSNWTWSQPLDRAWIAEHFNLAIDLLSEQEQEQLADTARDAGEVYTSGETLTVTLDGWILSDNIELVEYETLHHDFSYSDHQPVKITFRLKE